MQRCGLYIICLVLSIGMISCANFSASSFGGKQIRSAHIVEFGKVVSVKPVELEGNTPILGTIAGGAVSGVLGSLIGGGSGRILSTVVGAGAGAVAGNIAERKITTQQGLEIEVKLDNGQIISIVQGADQSFSPGERVRVLRGSDGSARVSSI